MSKLLEIRDLRVQFGTGDTAVRAVDGISYDVEPGETVALVGESGCGKSVSVLSITRLIPTPPARIVGGEVLFDGQDLLQLSLSDLQRVRGMDIAYVFQEPMSALNPVLSIGRQMRESLELHMGLSKHDALGRAAELMRLVGISDVERVLKGYPHQLSGGMSQRVMIAMALTCEPKLLIADEPTTAVDVTIQAQILELVQRLSEERGLAVILVTHNMGLVARHASRVNVMYAGKIVEQSSAYDIYAAPRHPYTLGLLGSVPRLDVPKGPRLSGIEGAPPDLQNLPTGCSFHPRCRFAVERCAQEEPALSIVGTGHASACWFANELNELAEAPHGVA